MGKAKGVGRRRKKNYHYKVNRKKLHRKLKKLPRIGCPEIKNAWDNKKSVFHNLEEMGLSANPNKTLKIQTYKDEEPMQIGETTKTSKRGKKNKPPKLHVAEQLEKKATEPQPKRFRLPKEVVKYCIYMIENYGEDYKAMARDPINYYQDTSCQIKKKIRQFKSVPEQWNAYMKTKSGDSDEVMASISTDPEGVQ